MPAQSSPLDQGHPRIVAIAASAGGLPVIAEILASLPADFPVAIVIVQHLGRRRPSRFVDILRQSAAVGVRWLDDGEHLDRGWAYVAPPGRHVVVNPDGRLALLDAPRVGYARLTANPLFASAAETYGRDAIAVVLTGWLFDKALIALTMMPGTMAMFRRPVAV